MATLGARLAVAALWIPVRPRTNWLGATIVASALCALLLAACGSGSGAAVETPNAGGDEPTAAPTQAGDEPTRWGYHPGRATGGHDPSPTFAALPAGYSIDTFVTGLEQPTSLAFTPDGRLLIAEQRGAIRVVEDGRLRPEPFFTADVFSPDASDKIVELGLVGITVDPAFEENGYVYIYYTAAQPQQRTVLARLRDETGQGVELSEIFSLDATPECCHIAGSLRFAPDGTLFVTVGDHQLEAEAQNRGSAYGTILRINPDGSAPADNPFAGEAAADARVYAYGLRNPFDLAIDPASGRIYATENGFIGQDAIIEIVPGANYGWPGSGLDVPLAEIAQPLIFYHQSLGPAGVEFYSGDALPALTGSLLFCQFHDGGALHAVSFNADGSVAADTIIALGCTSDVQTGPDGKIYFLDYVGGTVYRIAGPS
ncbi:MAG: PQQ-dependent sugar dehydrogenase [Chloroflexi bacterium]|nr:PQQ-dependent sugar dehydrogenase [Chloroflexota bacterium]